MKILQGMGLKILNLVIGVFLMDMLLQTKATIIQ